MNKMVQPNKKGNLTATNNHDNNRLGSERKYTLVLDLDETLIHYIENGDTGESYFLIRPFCNEFLSEMAQYYEVVIFTAGVKEYADWVID